MKSIKYYGNSGATIDFEAILGAIKPIIILYNKSSSYARRKLFVIRNESGRCFFLVSIGTANMKLDFCAYIQFHGIEQPAMIFKFGNASFYDLLVRRIENDELIWMHGYSKFMLFYELTNII